VEICIPTTTTTSPKKTKSCTSTGTTLTSTEDVENETVSVINTKVPENVENQTVFEINNKMPEGVENQRVSEITPNSKTPKTISNMTSQRERCTEKGLLRLKEQTKKLSMGNKKRKKKIHRLTQKIKRLKLIVQRVRSNRKKSNNKTTNIKQS
jgi:hypothetical protein